MFAYEQQKEDVYHWLQNNSKSIFKDLGLKDIFLYALALGFKDGARLQINKRRANIRLQYFNEQDEWLLKVVAISEAQNLDILTKPKDIINIAEEYANRGITLLQTKMNNELGDFGKIVHEEIHDILISSNSESNDVNETKGGNKNDSEKNLKVNDYLKIGESDEIEYKSSARWDLINNNVNKELEKAIVKSVNGFLNTSGGTLLIGVHDSGTVLGIKKDLDSLKKTNQDSYFQYLTNLFSNKLGVENTQFWHISFEDINGKLVCMVKIEASPKPVFVRDKLQLSDGEFYIRVGPTTRPLNNEEFHKYNETY